MSAPPCPHTADDLTARFMGEVLAPATGGRAVTRVELEPTGQQAFSSTLVRVHLRYDGEPGTAPERVVVKLASSVDEVRARGVSVAEREMRFYEELGDDPGIAVPRCYHVGRGDDGFYCLVLEDLGAGQIGKSRAEHASELLEALAPFHARFWNGRGLEDRAWLRTDPEEWRAWVELYRQALQNLDALGPRFPPHTRRVAEHLATLPDGGLSLAEPGPRGLMHGDLHMQQVFFAGPRGGRFAVFDWQSLRSDGNPLRDVSRPLVTSLEPGLRRAHEAGWLQRYHAALLAHGVTDFSFEQCLDQYRRSMLTTVFLHVYGAGIGDVSYFEERTRQTGIDWTDRFFGWVEAGLSDHDVVERYCR